MLGFFSLFAYQPPLLSCGILVEDFGNDYAGDQWDTRQIRHQILTLLIYYVASGKK